MKPKLIFFCLFTFIFLLNAAATVRYVSKTGSSTPPYTSWAAASDSIQKCINICQNGDTVYVANGVYKETLIINKEISLIGSSMDSTVIDGSNTLPTFGVIYFLDYDSSIENFNIIGPGISSNRSAISTRRSNVIGKYCRISNALDGLSINFSSANFSDFIIKNTECAVRIEDPADTSHPTFTKSLILYEENGFNAVNLAYGGTPNIENNIIIRLNSTSNTYGISSDYTKGLKIVNNHVAGFGDTNIDIGQIGADSAYVINNNSLYAEYRTAEQTGSIVISSGEKTVLKNNIMGHGYRGVYCYGLAVKPEYNLFWDLKRQTSGNIIMGEGNIELDPMFINDTLPNSELNFNYHLQKYSPAIDRGDPNILDKDGTRSDIGMYGGPLGEFYTYQDLAPKPPRNLSVIIDTSKITLRWNKNTEADTAYYKVYRDTVPNFNIDSTKLVSAAVDTFFIQSIPENISKYVYKVTCVDNQGNQSNPSEEIVVNITAINDYPVTINDYLLYQNFPNPFNPSTTIGYKLKERGYVKLMVYDIKGELVKVLVNQEQEAGYYEVNFDAEVGSRQSTVSNINKLASGIYLYRIEVIGEGNIPVYTEMKKMLMIK